MTNKTEIKADLAKNRLNITLAGFFTDPEMKIAADKAIQEAKKLKPGFAVITDISEFKPATRLGAEELKRAQETIKSFGMGQVVRIVGDAAIAQMQFARKSKEVGYEAEYAASIAEAEQLLDR